MQVQRVVDNVGVIAAAGELAIRFGVVPWEQGAAIDACDFAFQKWLKQRGGVEADEVIQGLRAVRQILELHGEARFKQIYKIRNSWREVPKSDGEEVDTVSQFATRDRQGFRLLDETDRSVYLVLPEAWKSVVCQGRDSELIAEAMADRGFLRTDAQGKRSVSRTLPGMGKTRVSEIDPSFLSADWEDL